MMKNTKGPTKHQIKSEATRTALLQAAEAIFARDGYERAQIDEIAKESGRTRGAVYAQYKTKEQLFFAVQKRRIDVATQDIRAMYAKIDPTDFRSRWEAIRKYFSGLQDEQSEILDLELKLYGLRHPEAIKVWQERYTGLFSVHSFTKSLGLSQKSGRSKLESRVTALAAVKSGLILSMKFLPEQLPPKEVRLILQELFEGLFHEDDLPPPLSNEDLSTSSSPRKKR
jgi:AcrR family transcriptional regulator